MKVSTAVTRLVAINPSRKHLIIQNLTNANLYIRTIESSDIVDYTDNGFCLKQNGIFEDFGNYHGEFFGYADSECDVRIVDLSEWMG